MTNHEINIAIAEACGWRFSPLAHIESKPFATMCWIAPNGADWQMQKLPDYCHDLNAMHEAEKTLGDRLDFYRKFLRLIATEDPTNRYNEPAFTRARQRAEAFLRALGKWEEKKSDFS